MSAPDFLLRLKADPFWRVPVGDPPQAHLRPLPSHPSQVREGSVGNLLTYEVQLLTDWRNRHCHCFLSEFTATPERTRQWLLHTVGPDPRRILFLVTSLEGEPLGVLGLANIDAAAGTAEIDHVLRGKPGQPGIMKLALHTLLDWGMAQLGLTRFYLRVRSDNTRAQAFYRAAGFVEVKRVGLRAVYYQSGTTLPVVDARAECRATVQEENGRRWIEAPGEVATLAVIYMEWRPGT